METNPIIQTHKINPALLKEPNPKSTFTTFLKVPAQQPGLDSKWNNRNRSRSAIVTASRVFFTRVHPVQFRDEHFHSRLSFITGIITHIRLSRVDWLRSPRICFSDNTVAFPVQDSNLRTPHKRRL